MRRFLLIVVFGAALGCDTRAAAQGGSECFSKFTNFNVCEKAREAQAGLAATLPMKLNANITISTAIVQGTRIIITAIWSIDKSEFDARIQANSTTLADLNSRMAAATKNSVCSMDVMAAFVRLGGQVQYAYRTLDHPRPPGGGLCHA
jgi:hypothetical protein